MQNYRQQHTASIVVSKFPHINFTQAFNQLSDRLLSPRARDLEWRILHQVVPVNAYLFRLHVTNNALCSLCRWPETLQHRFFSCTYVRPLWTLVEQWMSAAVAEPVTISPEAAIFLQYPDFKDTFYLRRLQILSGEQKLSVWLQRNGKKYDRARITGIDIHRLFIYFVRVRVRADFHRLDQDTFSRLWCQGDPPLASAAGRLLTLYID